MDEIGEYMSSPPLSVDGESTVQEAAQFMEAERVGSLLVKEYGEYTGLITESDITRKVVGTGRKSESTRVTEIMTKPILSMDRYLPVDQANEFMRKNNIRHLAVTEEDKIVGMLSVKDLVAYYTKSFRMEE